MWTPQERRMRGVWITPLFVSLILTLSSPPSQHCNLPSSILSIQLVVFIFLLWLAPTFVVYLKSPAVFSLEDEESQSVVTALRATSEAPQWTMRSAWIQRTLLLSQHIRGDLTDWGRASTGEAKRGREGERKICGTAGGRPLPSRAGRTPC